ncbi:MAG: DUF6431 domain-containing protein [Acidimicrobiales bacterium]
MTGTVAIVWPCPLGVDEYEAAGRDVEVPRPDCPGCAKPMIFWSGYSRTVRDGADRRIWVRRSRCVACATSHGLLPAFCLLRRLYSAGTIGPAVAAIVDGAVTHAVAEAAGFPYTTVRDWRRRHRDHAPSLAAGFAALSVALGAVAPRLAPAAERAALEALRWAWATARSRFGEAVAAMWRFWSLVSGGAALSTTTGPPWISVGGRRLIPPVP